MKHAAKITILNSIITIVLCAALMCGATMALFTSRGEVNIAMTSGKVNVVATPLLTKATTKKWDEGSSSYIEASCLEGNTAKFATGGTASIDGGNVKLDRIMPGDSVTVQIVITNKSTIDVKYQLRAKFQNDSKLLDALDIDLKSDTTDLQIFDKQFKTTGSGSEYGKASKWQSLSAASASDPVATLTLTLTFPFPADLNSMQHQGETANITLSVYAVQGNAHVEDPVETAPEEVAPSHASVEITAAEVGNYKILEAKEEKGYDFLYWAYKPSGAAASYAARSSTYATTTDFGTYLTNNPVYKFRVTKENLGTYHAVYRASTSDSKVIRLNAASSTYTIGQEDVGKELTFIAEEETWCLFRNFTLDDVTIGSSEAENFTYTFKPTAENVGKIFKAVYVDLALANYEDLFDNTGAIDYEAHIVNENVERTIPEGYGSGGLDGVFTVGEFDGVKDANGNVVFQPNEDYTITDYPIYNRGYQTREDTSARTKHNAAVYAENDALSNIGNFVMKADGTLWDWERDDNYAWEHIEEYKDDFVSYYNEKHPDNHITVEELNAEIEAWEGSLKDEFYFEYLPSVQHYIWKDVGHLYKHVESENLYLGEVDKNQPAVEKVISATPRGSKRNLSPTLTGLYAPAGEVITFKMSKEDFERTGGMIITIGMVQMNGLRRALDSKDNSPQRPPYLTTQLTVTPKTQFPDESQFTDDDGNYVFYFGSYIGGPIYVSPYNAGEPFTIDISGAVEYQHYIYGVTTEDEFNARQTASAPFFECWIPTEDVRFTGPRSQVSGEAYDFENFVKVSRLWEQIARISKQFPGDNFNEHGVMFNYDLYILGGAGAFTAINTVNAHFSWMGGALNYDSMVKYGNWGNIHEFNHCYQLFGNRDAEVSNNAINLVELAMLTDVSAARQRNEDGTLTGLSGWGSYTDPAYALLVNADPNNEKGILNGSQDRNLCRYANLFYGFGIDRFIDAMQRTIINGNFSGTSLGCGYDMQYYFKNVISGGFGGTDNTYENLGYPMFVPVASPYQIGVGHKYTKEGVGAPLGYTGETVTEYTHSSSPYRINMNEPFTLDFEKTLAIPKDFNWTIECTQQPEGNGIQQSGRNFTYTASQAAIAARTSGRMVFTVTYSGIVGSAAAGIKGEVEIVVQFDQMPGTRPDYDQLDRTVYTYNVENLDSGEEEEIEEPAAAAIAEGTEETPKTSEQLFEEAKAAWLADIKSSDSKSDGTFTDAMYMTTEPNALPESAGEQNNTAVYFDEINSAPANSFIVVSGIYTPKESGTYYLGLESIGNSALYISEDGTNYTLFVACGPAFTNAKGAISVDVNGAHRAAAEITLQARKTIYFREVLAPDETNPNGDHVKMLWGAESCSVDALTDQPAASADHTGYAYRLIETVEEEYELEYWTDHEETYFDPVEVGQSLVEDNIKSEGLAIPEYLPFNGYNKEPLALENLFNENPHDIFAVGLKGKTLNLTVKLVDIADTEKTEAEAKSITADSFIIHAYPDYAPTAFKLYVGDSADEINTLVYEQDVPNGVNKNGTIKCSFKNGPTEFSYYRLEISETVRGRDNNGYFLVFNGIEFGTTWNVKQPSDRDVEKLGAWDNVRTPGSTFGYLITAKGKTDNEPFSTLTMKFTGTQLHIRALRGPEYGAVEILIDGKWLCDIDLRHEERGWVDILSKDFLNAHFQSDAVFNRLKEFLTTDEEHTLTLRSTEAFNVDAVYYR